MRPSPGRLFFLALAVLDRSLVASCKDSVGWMFSKLDTNNDLYLDRAELAAINLDKYEICIRPFFNSCDSYRDGKVSTAEWCLCFWRESAYSRGGCACTLVKCPRVPTCSPWRLRSYLKALKCPQVCPPLCRVLVRHYLSSYSPSCVPYGRKRSLQGTESSSAAC